MNIRHLCQVLPTVFLLLLATQVHAEPEYPNLKAACASNPERCAQARGRMAAKCKEGPATCAEKKEKLDKRIGELKAKCEANPETCAEKREKMHERAAAFKAKCEADPKACEEQKAKLRERMEQRRENTN